MNNSTNFPKTKFQLVAEMIREEIEKRGTLSFKVVSKSMSPLIRTNDNVIVEKCDPKELVSGEIIVFNIGRDLCTHRYITSRKKSGLIEYITKGDRFFKFDSPVTEDKIVGKVSAITRQGEQIDLSRGKYRIIRFCLGAAFKLQWFLFRFLRNIYQSLQSKIQLTSIPI